jgi:[ribosomal protein S5]-alanine N-acetyltransferase
MVYALCVILNHGNMILYETTRVALRRLASEDREEFVELVKASADFLNPWVYLPSTSAKFDEYIQRFDGKAAECTLICDRASGAIAGCVSISDIIRGPYQRATVGYNAFAPSARRGYMSEGLGLVFRFAFDDLALHRLEADIQPGNEASLRLAQRVGFRREGYSPGFVRIGGEWKDHERWAINSDMIT